MNTTPDTNKTTLDLAKQFYDTGRVEGERKQEQMTTTEEQSKGNTTRQNFRRSGFDDNSRKLDAYNGTDDDDTNCV